MSAPVRIEARAWGDIRFATLARLLGLADSDHALIKVARLWSWQTEHFTADEPTYVLDADTIESVLGVGGPAALVRAKLASEVPGGYRLHGTEGQIEWCEDLSSTRQQAGRARAAGARRDARGRLLPRDSGEHDYKPPAGAPANVQHVTSGPPAKSSAPSPAPSPEDQDLPPARDPAVSVPEQVPAPTLPFPVGPPPAILPVTAARAEIRRQLIGHAWQLGGDAFRELGREGIEPAAFDPWAGMPGAGDEGMKLLIAHVDRLLVGDPPDVSRALAVIKRRVAVAVAEGRAASPRTRRWITPMRLWDPISFAKGAETSPEQVRPRSTARPGAPAAAPAAKPDPGPPPLVLKRSAEELAALSAMTLTAAATDFDRMPTHELVKRFGDGQRAPPASTGPTDDTPDEKPRRKAAK